MRRRRVGYRRPIHTACSGVLLYVSETLEEPAHVQTAHAHVSTTDAHVQPVWPAPTAHGRQSKL